MYWWAHLANVETATEEFVTEFEAFTSRRLLQWLELLSLMGSLQSSLMGLSKAIARYNNQNLSSEPPNTKQGHNVEGVLRFAEIGYSQENCGNKSNMESQGQQPENIRINIGTLLYDASRVIQALFRPVSESALQIYNGALIFMPCCSLSPRLDELCAMQVKIISKQHTQWGQDLRVMEGHEDVVGQVAVSPNGLLLASLSEDNTIRLWVLASGVQLMRIDSWSYYLVFSPDGSRLFSLAAVSDELETWDTMSGSKLTKMKMKHVLLLSLL